MTGASVQTIRLGVSSIRDSIVTTRDDERHAVVEVIGVPRPQGDDIREAALLAGFAAFLNALSYPIQILVRATPVDLSHYVAMVEDRGRWMGDGDLADLAHDHALFVQSLSRQRMLLERRFFVVVGAEPGPARKWSERFRARHNGPSDDDEPRRAAARHQLAFRCDDILRQLQRCGLTARRLADLELAELYVSCWSPERARVQRFRQQLDDYTTLAVRGPDVPSGVSG